MMGHQIHSVFKEYDMKMNTRYEHDLDTFSGASTDHGNARSAGILHTRVQAKTPPTLKPNIQKMMLRPG